MVPIFGLGQLHGSVVYLQFTTSGIFQLCVLRVVRIDFARDALLSNECIQLDAMCPVKALNVGPSARGR